MSVPERYVRMFGGIDNVPDYLKRGFAMRDAARKRRDVAARAQKIAKEREFQRKRSLRRPPARVWLVRVGTYGMEVHWEPPETADQLPPTGYIVSGDSDSSQLLPPSQRKQWLRIYKPGNRIAVTTDYSQHQITKLGEHSQFTRQAEGPASKKNQQA